MSAERSVDEGIGRKVGLIGLVAEWLGRALQKLLQQFESARDLPGGQDGKMTMLSAFFFAESRIQAEYVGNELIEMSSSNFLDLRGQKKVLLRIGNWNWF